MKNLKKVLALVMAFAMAFTMMAGAAYTDQDDIQATDAVELLATLNVMTGKGDGMFHPNDTITRAEICRIIYTIRNEGNDNANAYADMQTSFQDLTSADDWAKGYIKHCQSVGLISGRNEAGTVFGPQDPVTGVELAVICLRVLGYDPAKAGIGGESWSTKTIGLASEAGLLQGVNMESVTGPCERQWAAQIMANMLDAYTVTWSTDSDSYSRYGDNNQPNSKVGMEYMKLHTTVGTLIDIDGGNLALIQNSSDYADSDGAKLTSFTNVGKDYSELLGQKVKVLYSKGKANSVIGVYALEGNTVYTVNANAVESDGKNKVKFDGKSYTIENITNNSGKINAYYASIDGDDSDNTIKAQTGVEYEGVVQNYEDANGVKKDYYLFNAEELFDNWDGSSAVMKFVDSDDNGRLDSVIITDYAAAEVTSATSTKIVAGKSYEFADHNIDEGIKQGDWVSISYNRFDDCKDIKKLEVTTGKLDGLKKDSKTKNYDADEKLGYLFDEYRVDSAWFNEASDSEGRTDINTVKAGDSIEYVLLNNAAWKVKRAGTGSLDDVVDVAMVVNKDQGIGGKQVKLQFFNDTTAVVDVDDKSDESYKALKQGQLYEYSISGGKYSFEKTLNTNPDFYGDYTYVAQKDYTFGEANIDGMAIDDKAKVILYAVDEDGNPDSDVITGKQLKALKAADFGKKSKTSAYYFTADVSGLTRAAALAMTVDHFPKITSTNDYYGYILDDAITSAGNSEVAYELLLENGETITVYEKGVTNRNTRKANTLIGYKSLAAEDSNGKRYIDEVEVYHVDSTNNFGIGAVTSVNSNQSTVVIDGYGKDKNGVSGNHVYDRDVTSDTVIFYVDTDDKTGSTTGSISKAVDWAKDTSDKDFAKIITSDKKEKVANCLYLAKDDEDLEVLVVDVADRMFRGPEVDNFYAGNKEGTGSIVVAGTPNATPGAPAGNEIAYNTTSATFRVTFARGIQKDDKIKMVSGDSQITMSDVTITEAMVKAGYADVTVNVSTGQPADTYKLKFEITRTGSTDPIATVNADLIINPAAAVDATMPTGFTGTTRLQAGMTVSDANIGSATLAGSVANIAFKSAPDAKTAELQGTANQSATLKVGDKVVITFKMELANGYKVPDNWEAPALWNAAKESANVEVNGKDVTVTITYTVPDTDANLVAAVATSSAKVATEKLTTSVPEESFGDLATQLAEKAGNVTVDTAKKTSDNAYTISLGGTYTKGADTNTKWEGFDPATYNTQDYFIVPLTFKAPEGAVAAKVTFPNISKSGIDSDFVDGNLVVLMAISTTTDPGTIKIQWLRSEEETDTMGSEITYSFTKAAGMIK